jgi:hypothetical protein
LAKISGGYIDSHGFTRDLVGNITQEAVNGSTWLYSYDDLYRLSASTVLGISASWQYDLAGNRTQQIANGVTTSYTVNAADRLTAVNGTAVLSDANGNVTQDETGGTYAWDVRGRLYSVSRNGINSYFSYTAEGERIYQSANTPITTYLLDGDSVVQ